MAIGTTLRVAFDANAVRKGLAALPALFSKAFSGLGRGLRQIGIGGARQMGSDLFGMIKEALLFIPNEIGALREMANEYGNLSRATDVSAAKLMKLAKAMQLAGMEGGMTVDTIRELSSKIGEALAGPSESRNALNDLGLRMGDLRGSDVLSQIQTIARAVQSFSGSSQDLYFAFDRLLGGDLGTKAVSFFQDYEKWTREAAYSSDGFANALIRSRERLQGFQRVGTALRTKFREALLAGIEGSDQLGSHSIMKQLTRYIEGVDATKLAAVFTRVFNAALRGGEWLLGAIKAEGLASALKEAFSGLGTTVREVIREGVRMGIEEGMSIWNFLKMPSLKMPGGNLSSMVAPQRSRSDPSVQYLKQIADGSRTSTRSLAKIERNGFPALLV